MPKITPARWMAHAITGQNNGPYAEKLLGDTMDLSQCGVHLERLCPALGHRIGIGIGTKPRLRFCI